MAIHEEHGRCVEEGYLRGVHEANDRFHLTLFGACGNRQLVKSIELYMRLSLPVRANSMADAASLKISHEHHRMMIEMLKGTRQLGAGAALRRSPAAEQAALSGAGGGYEVRGRPGATTSRSDSSPEVYLERE